MSYPSITQLYGNSAICRGTAQIFSINKDLLGRSRLHIRQVFCRISGKYLGKVTKVLQ